MKEHHSAGHRFRIVMKESSPLQIVGTTNAQHALLAKQVGFSALYLSGGGVAAGSLGVPDLGITQLEDVLIDVNRITNIVDTPLLVDIDTGFGPSAFNIELTIRSLIKAGAAAVHIEDQVGAKRCGHRPGKEVVTTEEMCDRIKAAVDARYDDQFVVGARTDALAKEGLERTLERVYRYAEAGADFIFAEAVQHLDDYKAFAATTQLPILANITEFGMSPLWTVAELTKSGVQMILYPLSAFRASNKAAFNVYTHILQDGGQQTVVKDMQTREELYNTLGYYEYEKKLDLLFQQKGNSGQA